MATKIVTKNSSTASAVPTASDLVQGELAVNVADKRLFTEDNAGAIVELGTNPTTLNVNGTATMGGVEVSDTDDIRIRLLNGATFKAGIQVATTAGDMIAGSAVDDLAIRAQTNMLFATGGNAERMRISSAGNVGIGVVPKTWYSASTALEIGSMSFEDYGVSGANVSVFANNLYRNTSNAYVYKESDFAASYSQYNGEHTFNTAPSGTADSVATLTPVLKIDSSGNVGIGTSSPRTLINASSSTGAILTLESSDTTLTANGVIGGIDFYSNDSSTNGAGAKVNIRAIGQNSSGTATALTFGTSSSGSATAVEAMRIDASGNVQVKGGQELRVYRGDNAIYGSMKYLTGSGGLQLNDKNGDGISFVQADGATEYGRFDSSGNLLVGTTDTTPGIGDTNAGISMSAANGIIISRANDAPINISRNSSDGALTYFRKDGAIVGSMGTEGGQAYISGTSNGLHFNGTTIRPSNNLGVAVDNTVDLGQSAYRFKDLHLSGAAKLFSGTNSPSANSTLGDVDFGARTDGTVTARVRGLAGSNGNGTDGQLTFYTASNTASQAAQERMRITKSGRLLVGKTAVDNTTVGFRFDGSLGFASFVRDGGEPLYLNRKTSDGDILKFAKDGSTVGSIGATQGNMNINSASTGLLSAGGVRRLNWDADQLYPQVDNDYNLGHPSYRYDDIYATNGTIQTSDFNEKQDIAELSDAEQRVAVAAKGLLRKFRWKDSVAEKGDEARTHFGIIAQDLQAAFAAEGLDAGDYAMFISSTWTDEETNEEKTRMGVRYSELLAFIIAAI